MKSLAYLFVLTLAACGAKHNKNDYGKMTTAQLIAEKGEPEQKKETPMKDVEIFQYSNNESYQVRNEIVTNKFRDPTSDEKALIYWRHKFKDCDTTDMKIAKVEDHTIPESELKCSKLGLSVIYTEGSGIVSRVVEHEKK